MRLIPARITFVVSIWLFLASQTVPASIFSRSGGCLSPIALAATGDGANIFVACGTTNQVLRFDTARKKVTGSITMPLPPSGLVLSPDNRSLYVTCAGPESLVSIVDTAQLTITRSIPAGHTSMAPVLSREGKTLYVCNEFNNNVSVIDLATRREVRRIGVQRQPVAAAITKDGRYLLVANHLSNSRADLQFVSAAVSVIDLRTGMVVKELSLPSGSEMLKGIAVSPDGKYAVVTHIFCNYDLPATRVELGLMNANAMTIIDLSRLDLRYTFLLDAPTRGAANGWGVAFSPDNSVLAVAHAGTHEVSVIDFPALLAGLPEFNRKAAWPANPATAVLKFVPHYEDEESSDGLPFLIGGRERVELAPKDLGPRAMVLIGRKIYTANYFSDTLSQIDLDGAHPLRPVSLALGRKAKMTLARKGELYFNDARLCFQSWQSCASCHPGDARVDALNWDLANDGLGNPKNTRSLLLACQLPPAMALGVRTNAELAVRAGLKFILFTKQPEAVPEAIVEYLKSLKPVPSPWLEHGQLSPAAQRGQTVFSKAGCAECHVPGLFADLRAHNVGTGVFYDGANPRFYTPSLIEVWRTAPYLHTGSAVTIRDVLTTRNEEGLHGDVSGLSSQELEDLCAYVLSL
jgi:YVTN family beta-propeller protein